LCQPRVIVKMIVEKQMECRLAGETEVLGENLPQRHFCPSKNPTWPDPGLNPGRHGHKVFFIIYYFYYLVCEAIGTAATPGLLCQPRLIVKMIVEKQMECRFAGKTEVLRENLLQRHFCPSQNPTWPDPGLTTGSRCGKPATNRLSYGAAYERLCSMELHRFTWCVTKQKKSVYFFYIFNHKQKIALRDSFHLQKFFFFLINAFVLGGIVEVGI
jgi:hypothetical protein